MPAPLHVWTLIKDGRTLQCELRDHPLGHELVLYEGSVLQRSEVVRDQHEMATLRDAWRVAAETQGWRRPPSDGPL
jgi:hypothetical protein